MAVDVCVCVHHRKRHWGPWNGPKGPCRDCMECKKYLPANGGKAPRYSA